MELVAPKRKKSNSRFWHTFRQEAEGWIYVIPVLAGVIIFTLIPMIVSLIYSLHDYDPTKATNQLTNFGFQNYVRIFTSGWDEVGHSLFITFRYAIVTVILGMVGSYALALFLNLKHRGAKVFRVIYYLPCLIPAVASTLLWKDITGVNAGYINLILESIGLPPYRFYEAKETVFPTILMLSVFGWGGAMIPWLASMQNIPKDYYEAAEIDGANAWQKLIHITIPLTTSMIFYLLITSIISLLQVFSAFYPLKNGIIDNEINFYVIMVYDRAFVTPNTFGYACALSWFLFVIIGALTALIFKTSKWVYYGEDN